jgi:hypothetical protein
MMNMRYLQYILILIFLGFMTIGCSDEAGVPLGTVDWEDDQGNSSSYAPMPEGGGWEYKFVEVTDYKNQQETIILEETKFRLYQGYVSINGNLYYKYGTSQEGVLWRQDNGFAIQGGIYLTITQDPNILYDNEIKLTKENLNVGDSWQYWETVEGIVQTATAAAKENITVMGASYNAIRVEVDTGIAGHSLTYWYAPGKGMVKKIKVVDSDDKIVTQTWQLIVGP